MVLSVCAALTLIDLFIQSSRMDLSLAWYQSFKTLFRAAPSGCSNQARFGSCDALSFHQADLTQPCGHVSRPWLGVKRVGGGLDQSSQSQNGSHDVGPGSTCWFFLFNPHQEKESMS